MKGTKKIEKARAGSGSKKLAMAVVLLMLNGCAAHYNELSSSGMPSVMLGNGLNKETSERFWAGVKPVSSLAQSHYKLGRYYQKSGKHALAIEEFTKAIELNEEHVLAYNGLGVSYDALKDCENAEKAYGKALHYGPDLAYLYNNLGCSRLLCNDPEHALVYLNKAAKLDTTTPRVHNNLLLAELRVQQQPSEKQRLSEAVSPVGPVAQQKESNFVEQLPHEAQAEPAASRISIFPLQTVANGVTDSKPKDPSIEARAIPLEKEGAAAERKLSYCDIEISNGNGVTGMAGRSAGYLRNLGFTVGRITNASHFNHGNSKIYYQDGYLEVAKAVALLVPGPQEIEQEKNSGRAGTGIRLLLGKDMAAVRFPENLTRKSDEQGNPMNLVADVD